MNKSINLPTFEEVWDKVESENYNPLDKFIYDNEPSSQSDADEFRSQLSEVINYVIQQVDKSK